MQINKKTSLKEKLHHSFGHLKLGCQLAIFITIYYQIGKPQGSLAAESHLFMLIGNSRCTSRLARLMVAAKDLP